MTKEQIKSDQDAKLYHICGKRILRKLFKSINYQRVGYHCLMQVNIEV